MLRLVRFLFALWKTNLLAAMEYRAAFITQVVGMLLNDAVYFIFWVIFFGEFKQIRGWGLQEMFLLFGIVCAGFGLASFLFGNIISLDHVIAEGRLDYYLSLPKPVLLHVLASRNIMSGIGDFSYGVLSFLVTRQFTLDMVARFVAGTLLSMIVIVSYMVLIQSLAFWLGHAQLLSEQASNAIVTFAIYPINLFDNTGKFLLFTVVPAAFVGAVPAQLVTNFSWGVFGELFGAAIGLLALAVFVFYRGLRRYESGSAIQIQV
ncbi:MAG: ABC transporter permease [Omnitrophica WOR_2 bacterium]